MPADLRLVPDAAERHPGELPAHGTGHRLAQRGLPDAGRAGQCQHRAAASAADQGQAFLGPPLADRQVLDDPVLHVTEPGVVGVQDRPAAADVVGIVGVGVPRDLEHRVQPGPDPASLRRCVRAALQLGGFLQRRLGHLLRQVSRLDPDPVVVFLRGRLAVQLGELLADRRELLAEQELALLLLHALADIILDGLGDIELGKLVARPSGQPVEPLLRVGRLQQFGPLRQRQVAGIAGAVRERRRVGDPLQEVDHLPGAALLQDCGGQPAVLAGELMRPGRRLWLLRHCGIRPRARHPGRRCRRRPAPGTGRG